MILQNFVTHDDLILGIMGSPFQCFCDIIQNFVTHDDLILGIMGSPFQCFCDRENYRVYYKEVGSASFQV
jgi:hypothetical protein